MTFRLTPQMSAALRAGQSPVVPLIEIELPGQTIRQLVGSGEVLWGSGPDAKRFVGQDSLFGTLIAAGDLEDGTGDEAPEWTLTFAPTDPEAASDLTAATAQGGKVRGWMAAIDRATGQIVPEPIAVFVGELDFATLSVGKDLFAIECRCVSALEAFHDQEVGARLSDSWHQMVWPGETGLANMTGIERTSYWGVERPPSNVTYGGGGGGVSVGGSMVRQL